ncbi:MAG: TRAP transporter small permease [Planctomycetota bacterium]|nr:TRAP transporter small permease [Planctomycetota bacterium]
MAGVKSFWKWLDEHFEESILIFFLIVITVLTGLQVLMRRVFSSPLSWSEELCRYCFMWSGFIGVAYCIRKRCEIHINTFLNLFHGVKHLILVVVGEIICTFMYAAFFYTTAIIIRKAVASQQVSPAIGIPNYIIYIGALLAFGLALIRQIQNLVRDARGFSPKKRQ